MTPTYRNHGPVAFEAVIKKADAGGSSVELSRDIETAFRRGGVLAAFRKLAYSHQREYALWIEEAKKPETRARRIGQTVEKLKT